MKRNFSLGMFLLSAGAAWGGSLAELPLRTVPQSWRPHAFMGSDYRLMVSDPEFLEAVGGGKLKDENLSLSEAAWVFRGEIPGKRDFVKSRIPGEQASHPVASRLDERPKGPYTIGDCFGRRIYDTAFTNRPFLLAFRDARPVYWLPGESPLADSGDFERWQARHPNFIGFEGFDELDSDAIYFERFLRSANPADAEVQRAFRRRYPLAVDGGGVAVRDWVAKAYPGQVSCHFGSSNIWPLASNAASYLSITASLGAKGLFYEATTQSHGSWSLAGAYLRGAARQWSIPWAWYGANWYGGVPRNDRLQWPEGENKWCCFGGKRLAGEPAHTGSRYAAAHRGASRTILARQAVYGWLIGSSFYWPEHWHWLFFAEKDGRHVLSEAGSDYENFYRLARRVDRGVSLTPLAILTPIDEPMQTSMWCEGFRDPVSQTAVFNTLVSMRCPSRWRYINRVGDQGCLYNSEFGEIYDVVTADSGQETGEFAKVLSAYPFALLAGTGFRREKIDKTALEAYVRSGGTLVVSADQIDLGYVSAELAGVKFGKDAYLDASHVSDGTNLVFLLDAYAVRSADATGARAVAWTDRAKRPVVFANNVGKGQVLSVACNRFLPHNYENCGGEDYRTQYERISSGRQTFELLKFIFRRIQEESLPLRVSGDVQFGVNRTSKGLLLWLFNNKGVVKFFEEPEELDCAKTALVTVDLKNMSPDTVKDPYTSEFFPKKGKFALKVPPGGWRLVQIEWTEPPS